jgi:hypothetical protein
MLPRAGHYRGLLALGGLGRLAAPWPAASAAHRPAPGANGLGYPWPARASRQQARGSHFAASAPVPAPRAAGCLAQAQLPGGGRGHLGRGHAPTPGQPAPTARQLAT